MLACGAMSALEAATLGIVQGLTEFLPISSSAHLYIVPRMLGWSYGGVTFDVALHMGTLAALLIAFWREWWALGRGAFHRDRAARAEAHGVWLKLAAATVPAVIVGLAVQPIAETHLRSLPLQAVTLAAFGLLMWAVDRRSPSRPADGFPGWGACMLVGCAQALSLVPGVSRSGVTMTAGRAAGMPRVEAARFSFLLGTPITLGAGLVELRKLDQGPPIAVVAIGAATSAIVGVLAIRGLIRWLGRAGFGAFCAYRVGLAIVIALYALRA